QAPGAEILEPVRAELAELEGRFGLSPGDGPNVRELDTRTYIGRLAAWFAHRLLMIELAEQNRHPQQVAAAAARERYHADGRGKHLEDARDRLSRATEAVAKAESELVAVAAEWSGA